MRRVGAVGRDCRLRWRMNAIEMPQSGVSRGLQLRAQSLEREMKDGASEGSIC